MGPASTQSPPLLPASSTYPQLPRPDQDVDSSPGALANDQRNRLAQSTQGLPSQSNEFYGTTSALLRDGHDRPAGEGGGGPMGDESRNRVELARKGNGMARPSSFFGAAEELEGEGGMWRGGKGGEEGGRGEWPRDGGVDSDDGTGAAARQRVSSFFGGIPGSSGHDESLGGGSREEGGTEERRSSFYGLDGALPPPPTDDRASPSIPPESTFRNIQHHPQDSSSGSSFSQDGAGPPRTTGARYHNAPYAASRAASVYNAPDPTPVPLLDQSHLRPGVLASLLTHEKTLDLYRANVKKTNDPDVQFEFCTFVMEVVGEMRGLGEAGAGEGDRKGKEMELVMESVALLSKLAHRGHVKSQYFLADCYTQGVGTAKGKRDYEKAYPLFVLAGKHGHQEACFRAAQCCEYGWGCKKDFTKAVIFLRRASVLVHPGAMHRLGLAEINGELGLPKRPREGVKWLKRAAELADQVDPPQPRSLHELAMLHEKGIDNIIFKDEDYAAELLARASDLQYAPSAFKLGECYEYGKMGCPQDSALSIHYYNIAAQQDHREACFALTAWYLVGSPGVLPQSDTEAYLWAKKAADMGLPKAQYAVGYFTEVGIGTHEDPREALEWFEKAAAQGDKRAQDRLRSAGHSQNYRSQAPYRPSPVSSSSHPLPGPPTTSDYKNAPKSNRMQKKPPSDPIPRRHSIDRGASGMPFVRRQRSHSQPEPVDLYAPPSQSTNYSQPPSFAPLSYSDDTQPPLPPAELYQQYGRPEPQHRTSSNGQFKPLPATEARMPLRQAINAGETRGTGEVGREERERVLRRKEGGEKDCIIS